MDPEPVHCAQLYLIQCYDLFGVALSVLSLLLFPSVLSIVF